MEEERIKEYIFQAHQAGKQETSGLVDHILRKMDDKIKVTIKEAVNGKIDKLHDKLDFYIKEDTDWKTKAEPVIKMGENVAGFGKVSLYVLGFIASVTGAVIGLIKLFEKK